jgi:hypothetical protein
MTVSPGRLAPTVLTSSFIWVAGCGFGLDAGVGDSGYRAPRGEWAHHGGFGGGCEGTTRDRRGRDLDGPPEHCGPDDPILASAEVRAGFDALWRASNFGPRIPQHQRLEQYAWIVETSDGFAFAPMNLPSGPCGPEERVDVAPPPGTVAWVHTHPWRWGEMQTSCGEAHGIYVGMPSMDDIDASRVLGLPGYIIDAHQITKFDAAAGLTPVASIVQQTPTVDRNAVQGLHRGRVQVPVEIALADPAVLRVQADL